MHFLRQIRKLFEIYNGREKKEKNERETTNTNYIFSPVSLFLSDSSCRFFYES